MLLLLVLLSLAWIYCPEQKSKGKHMRCNIGRSSDWKGFHSLAPFFLVTCVYLWTVKGPRKRKSGAYEGGEGEGERQQRRRSDVAGGGDGGAIPQDNPELRTQPETPKVVRPIPVRPKSPYKVSTPASTSSSLPRSIAPPPNPAPTPASTHTSTSQSNASGGGGESSPERGPGGFFGLNLFR